MMNRIRIFSSLFIICIAAFIINQCSVNQISGGTGAETGNPKIAGIIVDTSGTPVADVVVSLYPTAYNPVTDTPPQFPFVDTTNTSGEYCFNVTDTGTYTVFAKQTIAAGNVIIGEITVNQSITTFATDTLKTTGNIRITFSPDIKMAKGFFYIPGTPINIAITDNDLAAGYVLIDSVPEGTFFAMYYSSTNFLYVAQIAEQFSVKSGQTTTVNVCPCSMGPKGYDPSPLKPIQTEYYSLGGTKLQLYAWLGESVAFLTKNSTLAPCVMRRIVTVLDSAYQLNRSVTSQTPPIGKHVQGRLSIAETPSAEGLFIGAIGVTGVEMGNDQFAWTYKLVAETNEFPQELFFVFGYNFNLYMSKLAFSSNVKYSAAVSQGFSVYMRFVTMERLGIKAAPIMNLSLDQFHTKIKGLMDLYLNDSTLTFNNTLAIDTVTFSDLKSEHLFASVLMKLEELYGNDFVMNIWKEVDKRPVASTTQMAVDNLLLASSSAAHINLVPLFLSWKFPVSSAAKTEASKLFP
jgi:hypothetical protein